MAGLLTRRNVIGITLGAVVAVLLDQLLPIQNDPSIADSLRFGLLAAVLLVVVARKAVRDRERSEDRRMGPT